MSLRQAVVSTDRLLRPLLARDALHVVRLPPGAAPASGRPLQALAGAGPGVVLTSAVVTERMEVGLGSGWTGLVQSYATVQRSGRGAAMVAGGLQRDWSDRTWAKVMCQVGLIMIKLIQSFHLGCMGLG
jgi:hypothetical protein